MNEGNVDLEDVIKVLRENGVSVELDTSGAYTRGTYILKRQGLLVETIELPEQCKRRLIHRLGRIYQIEIRRFYFREQLERRDEETGATPIQAPPGNESQDATPKPNGVPGDPGASS